MNGMTRSRFRKLPILRPPSRPPPRWCRRRPGARVNLACDILAKHVEKLLRRLDLATEGRSAPKSANRQTRPAESQERCASTRPWASGNSPEDSESGQMRSEESRAGK